MTPALALEILRWAFLLTAVGACVGAWYAIHVVRAAERDVRLAATINDRLRAEMHRALVLARVLGAALGLIAFICVQWGVRGYSPVWRRSVALVAFFALSWLLVWVARYLANGLRDAPRRRQDDPPTPRPLNAPESPHWKGRNAND